MGGDRDVATLAGEPAGGFLDVGDKLPAMLMGLRLVETTAFDKTNNVSTLQEG